MSTKETLDAVGGATNALLDKVVGHTQTLIEAATPVVKQAYAVGLMTLQIDALQRILITVAFLIVAFTLGIYLRKTHKAMERERHDTYKAELDKYTAEEGCRNGRYYNKPELRSADAAEGLTIALSCVSFGVSAFLTILLTCNVWLWIKLFKPELWLAHEAIEAAMKAMK